MIQLHINATSEGRPHLGAPIGMPVHMEKLKVNNGILEVDTSIATSQPHAAYACFTHGLISRWLYASCTIPDVSSHFLQLHNVSYIDETHTILDWS